LYFSEVRRGKEIKGFGYLIYLLTGGKSYVWRVKLIFISGASSMDAEMAKERWVLVTCLCFNRTLSTGRLT
jgi:hypothetical protein